MITNNSTKEDGRAIVIAGINGDIGSELAQRLMQQGRLYGVSRSPKKSNLEYQHMRADFQDPKQIASAFEHIAPAKELIYLHLIGVFRFEDKNHPIVDKDEDDIDDETFQTNVTTFRNVKQSLSTYLEKNPSSTLKIIGVGSSSDLYDLPFWRSFTRSKNELRKEFRLMYGNPQTYGRVSALTVNVSTVSGKQLSTERPYISKEFCLSPQEVAEQSMPYILDPKPSFLEVSLIKPNPSFMDPEYLTLENLRKRWYQDMYANSADQKMKGGNTQ